MKAVVKEQTLFDHEGDTISLDRDVKFEIICEEPLVVVLKNVVSDEECTALINLSKDKLKRSKIGESRQTDEQRTSSSMFFEENENDLIISIENRISNIMQIPIAHAEGLQILKYSPGQEYKAHYDFFNENSKAASNNRISTMVMYLNEVTAGGDTYFPSLDISVSPEKGSAVYFEYFYNDQNLNNLTLHGGAPVIEGEKWVATQWMRKQRIR